MSDSTGPAPTSRPPLLPTVLGLVLVAAVIGGALAIERATDGDVDLPDTLAEGLPAEPRDEMVRSAESRLEEVMDADAVARSYRADEDRGAMVMVIDRAAGPFAPRGPHVDPELLGLERGDFELITEGEAVCQVVWPTPVPEGEDVPDVDPAGVQCQLGADGRTYLLYGTGMTAEEAVDMLEGIAD